MATIFERIETQLPAWRERVSYLTKTYGEYKVCDVTVEQIYGGIRGVQIQVSDISFVDPQDGIRLRGFTINEVLEKLPRQPGMDYPLAGGLYYLLLTEEIPTLAEALEVEEEWRRRGRIPQHVYDIILAMPGTTHPMTLFSQGIMALQTEAVFPQKHAEGLAKKDYWKYFLEDSLNLTAKLPALAAFIYNLKYNQGVNIPPDPNMDWSGNFATMIGHNGDHAYHDLCRLFFILHSDHEGGNVSAHTSHLVCSALSDVYLTCAAGMNGLAGPLHGLANQECIRWLLGLRAAFDHFPTPEEVGGYCRKQLASGQVIPGYGHAVLRTTDPRFTAQQIFAKKHFPDDDLYRLVEQVYSVLPEILKETGKVSNPYPNVDAINGALQFHFGVTQFDFYTVLFGISRMLGLTAHAVWSRALGKPIERPKSLTTPMLEQMVADTQTAAKMMEKWYKPLG